MKILFILELYKPHNGGVETLFYSVISRLASKGHKIVILTTKFKKDLPGFEIDGENIEIYRVGYNRYDFMFFSLFRGFSLAKKCDIIHTTTYNAAIPAWIIAKITGKKIVITVHEIFGKLWYKFMGWKGFFFKLYESFIFIFKFDKFVCVSNYTKNNLRVHFGISDNKLITIYNGIDYKFWNESNFDKNTIAEVRKKYNLEDKFVGFCWGRPGISKGLEYYIMAIPSIIASLPDFKALLVVSDHDKKRFGYIKELIKKLNIKDKNLILLQGSKIKYEELGNYILASDFVIVPSLAEGFGFNIVEAGTLGQKLIITNIASIPEVASGKVSFVEPGNVKDIFRKVIALKQGNYEIIPQKKFSWDDNIEKTLEVYEEVLGG